MIKKVFLLLIFFTLTNCAAPGSAFLGPVITGAKTGSVYQASVSYSSGKIMNTVKNLAKKEIISKKDFKNDRFSKQSIFDQSKILAALTTTSVDVFQNEDSEEPLP